jgi:hypothetical protein
MGTTTVANPVVFPSHNDIAPTEHLGDRGTEPSLSAWSDILTLDNFVLSGYVLTNGGGLTLQVASGEAWIDGRRCSSPITTNHALTASVTNYVYLQIVLDVNGYTTELRINSNSTGTPPANSVFLGTVLTDGVSILTITDFRHIGPRTQGGLTLLEKLVPTVATNSINFATVLNGNFDEFYLIVGRLNNPNASAGNILLTTNISATTVTLIPNAVGGATNGRPNFFFLFICAKDTTTFPARFFYGHYYREDGVNGDITGLISAAGNITTLNLSSGGTACIGPASSFCLYRFKQIV